MSKASTLTKIINAGKNVVTRVAPSPTGMPHIGTAYIGLMNYLFAKKHNGKFILRIEDTDLTRSKHLYEKDIVKALKWIGLSWDEGPDIGGPNGPYRQSERIGIYKPFIDKLLDSGNVFPCFCTPQRLEQLRAEQNAKRIPSGYDGHCLHLSYSQQKQMMANIPFVLRQKIPDSGYCEFNDLIKGSTKIPWSTIDMQVLIKSDKMPTYHLANVLDDHLMGVSHVIRGEEWVSSTPKHLLLYNYLGLQPPLFAHLPLLRNEDMSKLSKRKSATSILWFENEGYLPEAMLNYLGLFAIPLRQSDKFTLQQLLDSFELQNITGSAPIFDIKKLHSLNALWIRENYTPQQFSKIYQEWAFEKENRLEKALVLAQSRSTTLSETSKLILPIINTTVDVQLSDFDNIKISKENILKLFYITSKTIDYIELWDKPSIEYFTNNLSNMFDIKKGILTKPFYIAITGDHTGLPIFETMCILGKDTSKTRINNAIKVLGGIPKEMQDNLEKIDLKALLDKNEVINTQVLSQSKTKHDKPKKKDDDDNHGPGGSSEGNNSSVDSNQPHNIQHNNITQQKVSFVINIFNALQDSILEFAKGMGLIPDSITYSDVEYNIVGEHIEDICTI